MYDPVLCISFNIKVQVDLQHVRLAGSFRCWFVKKYGWLVCVREKYCSGLKFTIVYDKPQLNEQAMLVVLPKIKLK